MKKQLFMSIIFALFFIAFMACRNSQKDLTPPVISINDFQPANCDIYYQEDTITVHFVCSDDTELGNFNIEIHSNFDHHTHSTEAEDCEEEHEHEGEEPTGTAWIFNQDFAIPANSQEYTADIKIPVPNDAADGEYHFMLRLTDKAGWQTIKASAIHIESL